MKKRFGETAFVLKAVFAFVFVRLGRRRARHDSFLSFLLLEGQSVYHAFLRNGSAQDEINSYFLFSAFAFGFQLFSLVRLINSSK